jgi:uncharacterized cupredoxin-like copper-binding protein
MFDNKKMRAVIGVLFITLLALVGCGGQEAAGTTNTVQVSEAEFEITMPTSIPAGPTTFEVTNNGTIEHNFEVEGEGIEEEFDENIQPGQTQTLELDLAAGTYEVYCPIEDHADQGMLVELTVTE